jgi:hypothetical protein
MSEMTLEALAKRIEVIEQKLAELSLPAKPKDWRRVVGISEDNEFTRLILTEIEANSEAERRAALEESPE